MWPFIRVFWEEYYPGINDPNLQREITDSTLIDGQGRKWAEKFYKQRYKNIKDLESREIGLISADKAYPLYKDIISLIIQNEQQEDEDLYIIQLGSCSGADLKIFYDVFPKLKFISTDINDEILEFQKEKYKFNNFHFHITHAENIDSCFKKFNLYNKKVILFSLGSLQYVNPFYLEIFFSKLKEVKDLDLFICDTIALDFVESETTPKSVQRFDICFNHKYEQYATPDTKVVKKEIIKPFDEKDVKKNEARSYVTFKNT